MPRAKRVASAEPRRESEALIASVPGGFRCYASPR
jgi:hypothetical protein